MKVKDIRIIVALLVMIGTFTVLVGGNFIYQRYFVQQPLAALLAQNSDVHNLQIEQEADRVVITVELGEVKNLQDTYRELEEMVRKHMGSKNWELRIIDTRTPNLERVWHASQFALYEAIVQGNFTHMARVVDGLAKGAGLDRYGLYIDENYLYLQLHQGQNFLYAVLPRGSVPGNQPAPARMALEGQGGYGQ